MRNLSFVGLVAVFVLMLVNENAHGSTVNGGFETGNLNGWTSVGQTGVQSNVVSDGNYAAWVGTVDFNGDNVNDFTGVGGAGTYSNYIQQTINVSGMTSLDLKYNYYTWDYYWFDSPGFQISINGTAVLTIGATADWGDASLKQTGWQNFSYNLTGYDSPTLDLTIYSGNTGGDGMLQSWAYVDSSAVPIPGAIWLLGAGLIGLVGIKRKIRI